MLTSGFNITAIGFNSLRPSFHDILTGAVNIDKPSVSAIAVIDLANELLDYEVISKAFLLSLGSEFNSLYQAWKNNDPIQEKRLPEQMLIDLWQQADCHIKNTAHSVNLGLNIGKKVNQQAKGVLANWLTQCSSLSEAFDVFNENIALLNPSEKWSKSVSHGQVRLSLTFASSEYPSIAIDRSMAAMLAWSSALTEEDLSPLAIELSRSKPSNSNEYANCFGDKLSFNKDNNCIVISEEDFNTNIKGANPYLKELISKQAEEIRLNLPSENTVTRAVQNLLKADLASYCYISVTCEALHLSRSTLFRKLKLEGTSFTELVKNSRLLLIKQKEGSTISDEALTEMLGFQDINSYYRFRKANSK